MSGLGRLVEADMERTEGRGYLFTQFRMKNQQQLVAGIFHI